MRLQDPDAELVKRAKEGDFSAFEALVKRHEKRLYNLALGLVRDTHDAQEVVQLTFLSVIEHLDQFREEAAFGTWISRIAMNYALKLLRKRKNQSSLSLEVPVEDDISAVRPEFIARWRDNPERLAQDREALRLVGEALQELDEKYRVVFVLRDIQQLSTKETAELLGISESNVKIRLMRARLMLRERLTRLFGDEQTAVERPRKHH